MFFKIFIFLIGIFYLTKWLVKAILPHVIRHQMDNFQDQFNQQNSNTQQKRHRREGSVRVEKVPQKPEPSKNDDDYVDYEEIK